MSKLVKFRMMGPKEHPDGYWRDEEWKGKKGWKITHCRGCKSVAEIRKKQPIAKFRTTREKGI